MKEEKYAAFVVRIWRAKQRVQFWRKRLGTSPAALQHYETAKDSLRLALLKFQTAALA